MWGISKLQRGFTLVELLITIGLLAVLSAGLLSLIGQGPRRTARDGRRRADLQKISSALELYRNDVGVYPLCSSGTTCNTSGMAGSPAFSTYITGNIPTDATTGRIYRYRPTPAGCDNGSTRCIGYSLCMGLENVPNPAPPVLNATCGGDCGSAANNCYEQVVNP